MTNELLKKPGGLLVEYGITDEQIAATKAKYAGLTIAEDGTGYEEVRKALAEVRTTRTAIERKRVDLKRDALEFGRRVDGEAKRITTLLLEIEEPLRAKKAVVDEKAEREARAEAERVKAEQEAAERAKRDAEEARLKAIRDAEEARIAEERRKLAEERAIQETQRKVIEEQQAQERARLAAIQKAEQERMERLLAEERAQLAAIQKRQEEEANKLALERAKVEAEQRRQEAARLAAERVEFEKQAKLRAEVEARERMEREQAEAKRLELEQMAREAEDAARAEAMKPDAYKLKQWAIWLASLTGPEVASEEAKAAVKEAVTGAKRIAADLVAVAERLVPAKKKRQKV